jgi:hypothetical protein
MDVGSDTFPRHEVTRRAAFEHLDPVSTVSTLNMMPEVHVQVPRVLTPPPPPPAMSRPSSVPSRPRTGMTLPPPPPSAARTFSRPPAAGSLPPSAAVPMEARRADDTEIVDIDAPEHRVSPGWDDPEEAATRVQAGSATALDMDWDDDEPPTQMRGEAGVGVVNDTARGVAMEWEGEDIDTRLREVEGDIADTSAYQPAGDSGRPSPFPTRNSFAGHAPAAHIESPYGAPSPFISDEASETAWGQDLRGTDRRSQLWLAAGALCIIALAFLVRGFFFSKEAPGLVTFATVPSDARVLVDGKSVAGTSSPFSAADLAPGVSHELRVEKDGYATHTSQFTVAEGEAKTLPTINLESSSSGFSIDSAPNGAQVSVDGQPTGLSTPARVTQLAPGMHKVELSREGFATYQLQVFVPESQVLELPAASLAPSVAGAAPKQAALVSEAPVAQADAPKATKPSRSELARERRHHRRAAARASSGGNKRVAAASRVKMKPIKAPVVTAAAGKGVLRVNSRPWAQVFVDGRMVGNTPQMNIQLPTGKHTIKLSNPQMGLSKTFAVTTKAGHTETKVMNLID